jgi:hypothetical protein
MNGMDEKNKTKQNQFENIEQLFNSRIKDNES